MNAIEQCIIFHVKYEWNTHSFIQILTGSVIAKDRVYIIAINVTVNEWNTSTFCMTNIWLQELCDRERCLRIKGTKRKKQHGKGWHTNRQIRHKLGTPVNSEDRVL